MAGAALDPSAVLPRPTLPIGSTGVGAGGRTYEILAIIERGGMGELFLARMIRPGLKPQYAVLKRLLADLLDDDKYVQMFNSEAQVMAELDHPNIVRVIDMPKIGHTQCLAMEYVRGRNVQQILSRCMDLGSHIPLSMAAGIMLEVLCGLEYAHRYRMKDGSALQLVHRDVTPGNVLVSFEGEVKLTDFGIAKSKMSMVSTTVGIVKGKARYLSPEQILGEAASSKSDIFAAAAVVSEMLTGVPAFDRGSVPKTLYAIVNGEMPDLERTLPFRAPQLVDAIQRALAPRPELRTPTAKAFADELQVAARAIGPIGTKTDIGGYLTKLFEDVEDPLADFFEDAEPETVHGPPPRLPSFRWNGRATSDQEVHEEEDPTSEMDEETAKRDAAASAYAAPVPTIVGTPVDPPKPTLAVDEALSVLAFLQSQRSGERATRGDSLKQIAKEAARDDTRDTRATRPAEPSFPRPLDRRTLIAFGAGALAGVLLTVAIQAMLPDQDYDAGSETPSDEPEEDAELVLEAIDKVEEAAVTTPPPIAEPPPPRPVPPRLGTLDILYPRGARARVDGKLMQSRVPIRGIRLSPGSHSVRVWKGKYRREIRFETVAGGRYLMNQKIKKR